MCHQRVGKQGNDLVEEIEGKDVSSKGDTLGAEYGHAETDIIPCLRVFLEGPHVAYVVTGSQNPEKGRDEGKDHTQTVRAETHLDSRQDGEQGECIDMPL